MIQGTLEEDEEDISLRGPLVVKRDNTCCSLDLFCFNCRRKRNYPKQDSQLMQIRRRTGSDEDNEGPYTQSGRQDSRAGFLALMKLQLMTKLAREMNAN